MAIRKKTDLYPRDAVLVSPGSTLHIRIGHDRRPDRVQLIEGLNWERTLDYRLKRVKRDDETVAWDVFFRVNRPDRRYYLNNWAQWDRCRVDTEIMGGSSTSRLARERGPMGLELTDFREFHTSTHFGE